MFKRLHRLFMHAEWKLSLWTTLFGAGGVMSSFGISAWAVAATEWLSDYGPAAWVFAGFAGAALFALVLLCVALAREKFAKARLLTKRAQESTRINPLEDSFRKEIITVADIFSYFHQILTNKEFRECRFVGPMVIAFDACAIDNPIMSHCNFVIVEEGGFITGVVAFKNSAFRNCEFDNVTFMLPKPLARQLKAELGKSGQDILFVGASLDA